MKNQNHFTVCFNESLNHISNRKHLDTDILYDEIANRLERAYTAASILTHGDIETDLKKLKETLNTSKLIIALIT